MDKQNNYGVNMNLSFVVNDDGGDYELGLNYEDTDGVKINHHKNGDIDNFYADLEDMIENISQSVEEQQKKKLQPQVEKKETSLEDEIAMLKAENEVLNKRIEGLINSTNKQKKENNHRRYKNYDLLDFYDYLASMI